MKFVMVDVESDGPIPGDYSMISFGAVVVELDKYNGSKLNPSTLKTFYGKLKPISEKWDPQALAVSGHSREETLKFSDPVLVMEEFATWLRENCNGVQPCFISDNNGFDWQFINWYFHHFTGRNPFGFSSQNLGSIYKGLIKSSRKNFKHLRKTKHSHDPVQDCIGNVEAFCHIIKELGYEV
jgi:hypothetical protein